MTKRLLVSSWHAVDRLPWERRLTTVKDGYRDYSGTIPVLATTLAQLRRRGPHGPVWWRYGHPGWETLQDALDNPEDLRGYRHREEQRRTEHAPQREREREEAESRRKAAAWPCPTCHRQVFPDDDWETRPPGSECTDCTSINKREREAAEALAAEEAAAREEVKRDGFFGFLR
ncbi:hypothetical protein OHB31_35610 [Streptomyces microflavus]|uniref:hypothetical protein n=1 Tax=Streptomyces microflavus TaxID=1919 RepID=UPI002DDB464E|nr:hypothetical protein [Streptomyces microflavus]WSA58644.1 hypothetical protein OHB31_00030 [Streptomyces microflavus]WSA65166.1 hypothetical protein OHB31_35610 [Streptomyces microflavus]